MAKQSFYRKKLIEPGNWVDGLKKDVVVTPERIDHWEKTFNQLRSEGFNFPIPWGHKLTATPTEDDPYASAEQMARWNSGLMDRLEKEKDGSLWYVGTVPPGYEVDADSGHLVNKKDGTIVTDVSPGIATWRDGKGRVHPDIIVHAALCTHPVQHNQSGFMPAGEGTVPTTFQLLSSFGSIQEYSFLSKGETMPNPEDDNKMDDVEDKASSMEPEGDEPPAPDADPELPKMPDGSDAPEVKVPEKESDPIASVKADEYVGQLKEIMAKLGQPMLDDTDRNNVLERMVIALKHAENAGATLVKAAAIDDPSMNPASPDLGMNGITEQNGLGGGVTSGGGYSFMSTATGKPTQLSDAVTAFAKKAADDELSLIASEWDKLAKQGPAAMQAIAHAEKNKLTSNFLSINEATGEVIAKAARRKLADTKQVLKASGAFEFWNMLSTTDSGLEVKTPANQPEEDEKARKENMDDMLRRMGAKIDNR